MKRVLGFSLLLLVILSITGCGLFTKYGSISGTITDSLTEEGVANVLVTVDGKSVRSDVEGNYAISKVRVGDRELTTIADGYSPYKAGVIIKKDINTQHDFYMDKGIRGYVTDGRGGPGVSGATVTYGDFKTTTDENGEFHLDVDTYSDADLFVSKDGRATVRVQQVNISHGKIFKLEIPSKEAFNPHQLNEPPVISTNIEPGAILSGKANLEISIDVAENSLAYVYYVYLGGEQRSPNNGFNIDNSSGAHEIDTTLFPNGETFIKILAYDTNDNAALYIFPVTIDNDANDKQLPADIIHMDVMALTFGTNIVFYGDQLRDLLAREGLLVDSEMLALDESDFDLEVAPEGATILNRLFWNEVADADSYAVSRSFNGINYDLIGTVLSGRYDDFSPTLAPNKPVFYKVVPRNSFGEGTPFIRKVTPLPAADVYLDSPANEAYDVALSPTFTWWHEFSSDMPVGVQLLSFINIWDGTEYKIWEVMVENAEEYTYTEMLAPGGVYSWDIVSSTFYKEYESDDNGMSLALSVTGEYTGNLGGTGSLNGEFIFTTLTD